MCVSMCAYVCVCIYPTSPKEQDVTPGHFLRSLTCLNSQFSFSKTSCHTNVKNTSLP